PDLDPGDAERGRRSRGRSPVEGRARDLGAAGRFLDEASPLTGLPGHGKRAPGSRAALRPATMNLTRESGTRTRAPRVEERAPERRNVRPDDLLLPATSEPAPHVPVRQPSGPGGGRRLRELPVRGLRRVLDEDRPDELLHPLSAGGGASPGGEAGEP